MEFSFPNVTPQHNRSKGLTFPVVIDGKPESAEITHEALRDKLGAASSGERDQQIAFIAHKSEIHAALQRVMSEGRLRPLLMADDFGR